MQKSNNFGSSKSQQNQLIFDVSYRNFLVLNPVKFIRDQKLLIKLSHADQVNVCRALDQFHITREADDLPMMSNASSQRVLEQTVHDLQACLAMYDGHGYHANVMRRTTHSFISREGKALNKFIDMLFIQCKLDVDMA